MNKVLTAVLILCATLLGYISIAGIARWEKRRDQKEILINGALEYKKLLGQYSNPQIDYNISGTISLYDSDKALSLKENTQFSFMRSGLNSFYQLNYLKIISNGTMAVHIDTVNQYILVSGNDSNQKGATPFQFEQFLSDKSQLKIEFLVSEKGDQRVMHIQSELNPEIKSIMITYSAKTYKIESAEISWWKDAIKHLQNNDNSYWLTKITYTNKLPVHFGANSIINNIIHKRNGNIEPLSQYSGYSFNVSN